MNHSHHWEWCAYSYRDMWKLMNEYVNKWCWFSMQPHSIILNLRAYLELKSGAQITHFSIQMSKIQHFHFNSLPFFSYRCSLPIPWLLYGIVFQAPVEVNSCGMVCSIAILFMMLLFVIASIACFHWRMNKGLGVTMFLLYFVFVAISLMFEYKHLTCPFWSVMTLNQKGKPIIQTNTRTHKLKHKYSTKPSQGIKYFPIDCRTE